MKTRFDVQRDSLGEPRLGCVSGEVARVVRAGAVSVEPYRATSRFWIQRYPVYSLRCHAFEIVTMLCLRYTDTNVTRERRSGERCVGALESARAARERPERSAGVSTIKTPLPATRGRHRPPDATAPVLAVVSARVSTGKARL